MFSIMPANLIHSSLSESIQIALCNHSLLSFQLMTVVCDWNVLLWVKCRCLNSRPVCPRQTPPPLEMYETPWLWAAGHSFKWEITVKWGQMHFFWRQNEATLLRNGINTARCWRTHHPLWALTVSASFLCFFLHFVIQKPKRRRLIGGTLVKALVWDKQLISQCDIHEQLFR